MIQRYAELLKTMHRLAEAKALSANVTAKSGSWNQT